MKLAWLTDIHLNFVPPAGLDAFFETLVAPSPDTVVISGDIGEAPDVAWRLRDFAIRVSCPIYFVLGNHDFYRGSFAGVREKIQATCTSIPSPKYRSTADGVVQLTDRTGLLGHDGW